MQTKSGVQLKVMDYVGFLPLANVQLQCKILTKDGIEEGLSALLLKIFYKH